MRQEDQRRRIKEKEKNSGVRRTETRERIGVRRKMIAVVVVEGLCQRGSSKG